MAGSAEAAGAPGTVAGIRLGTAASGARYKGRDDLAIIEVAEGSSVACLFTQNRFCAAPVVVARRHLAASTPRYLVINAGNANAGTGHAGEVAAVELCTLLASEVVCPVTAVLPFSTGVIGKQLNVHVLAQALPAALRRLSADGWPAAARAIMTTDTRMKLREREVTTGAGARRVVGIAKGSGMIKPNMATMLAYVATDAAIAPGLLSTIAKEACGASFNRITVDGDTSTNDAMVLIATGASGDEPIASRDHPECGAVVDGIMGVCRDLAQDIVRDGEGATKFVTVKVAGGDSVSDCLAVGYAVAESPLVKTALFASDPNWGRILAAVGRADVAALAIDEVSIAVGDCTIVKKGQPAADYDESVAAAIMQRGDIEISIGIGAGPASIELWTCDFSYDYVKINAEYRS